jgi:flagellar hook-length control protein FliK
MRSAVPSVASDSPAVPPSRSPLPSLRNAADPNRNEPATPFADLLDSATPAPEPPPPQARADRPDRTPDAPPSHHDSKPANKDASQDANAPAAKDAKDTKAAAGTDPNNAKAGKDAKAAKDAKTAKPSTAKLTLDKDLSPSADKSKPDADPTAAIAAPVVPAVPVATPQAALLATGQLSAAPADADATDADALAALTAAGQGQRADTAKPGTQAEKQSSADAKAAASTDTKAAAGQVEPAKDGQPRGNGDKPAAQLHQGAAELLAKADGALAASSGDTGAAAKAGADAVQSIGGAAPATATTATAAATPAATLATPAQAAAVPLSGLAVEITSQAQAGNKHFEIRLDPPELGRIDVKLNVDRDGNVSTQIVADRSDTLDLLKRDASTLERALQQAGLKTGDNGLDFSLRQQAFTQDDTASQNGNSSRLTISEDNPAPLEAMRQGYGRLLGMGGGLDIRI